jgi:glutathione S-transferase
MKKRLVKAFELMLDFFGMQLKDEGLGLIERGKNYKERYHSLKTTPHNFLRISRIIKSLTELGQVQLSFGFCNFLTKEILENEEIENGVQSLMSFWIPSLPTSEREQLEKYIKEKDLINLFIQRHKSKQPEQVKPHSPYVQQHPFKKQTLEKKQPVELKPINLQEKPTPNSQQKQPKVEMKDLYQDEMTPSQIPNFISDLFKNAMVEKPQRNVDISKLKETQTVSKPKPSLPSPTTKDYSIQQTLQHFKKQRLEEISETPYVIAVFIGEEKTPVQFFNFPDNISPHGWRVHLALEELNVSYEEKLLNPSSLDHRSPAYLQINERGEVPTIIDEGIVVSESMAILQYLNETHGEGSLMPENKKNYATALTRMSQYSTILDPIFSQIVLKGRFLKLNKKELKKDIEDLFHELSYWDYYLEKSVWLAGEFSLADILLFPVIAECVHMGLDVDFKYPHLGRWFRFFRTRKSSKKTWPTWMGSQLLAD